jgi:dolichol-phosphate mannosyltransferase
VIATPEISVVIPFYNEAELAESVTEEVLQVLTDLGRAFEIVLIDDGSSDGTLDVLMRAQARSRCCRLVRHPRNVGQGAALWHGLHMARGAILVTLDGDGQNDPADLPALLEQLNGADMVVGIRAHRHDPVVRSR